MEESGPTFDGKAKLLTICDLQGVIVGVAQERPVAHRRPTVFGFTNQTAVGSCELAQSVDLLARGDTDAQMGEWQQRLDIAGSLNEHDGEWPRAITDPRHARATVDDMHVCESPVERDALRQRANWKSDVRETDVRHGGCPSMEGSGVIY
jgi:hypothetical protein